MRLNEKEQLALKKFRMAIEEGLADNLVEMKFRFLNEIDESTVKILYEKLSSNKVTITIPQVTQLRIIEEREEYDPHFAP